MIINIDKNCYTDNNIITDKEYLIANLIYVETGGSYNWNSETQTYHPHVDGEYALIQSYFKIQDSDEKVSGYIETADIPIITGTNESGHNILINTLSSLEKVGIRVIENESFIIPENTQNKIMSLVDNPDWDLYTDRDKIRFIGVVNSTYINFAWRPKFVNNTRIRIETVSDSIHDTFSIREIKIIPKDNGIGGRK